MENKEAQKINGNSSVTFHSKNKSAALTIPKLDLSRLKKEIDKAEMEQLLKF